MNEPTKDPLPVATLSPEVVARLRESLQRWMRGADASDSSALGETLRAAATEARERGIRAEELLVTLKATWFEIGGSPNAPHPTGPRRLDELVTACIKAYYG